jgi:hypothetical protein
MNQPGIPEDFGQPESLRLQGLNNARDQAEQDLHAGVIDPNTHADVMRQIQTQAKPLQIRQEMAKTKAQHEQMQQAMQQQAMQHAMAMEHHKHMSENVRSNIMTFPSSMADAPPAQAVLDPSGKLHQLDFHREKQANVDSE